MWVFRLKSEKNKFGYYTIPENCINSKFYRFDELLKIDEHKLIKSAVINWFNEKHKFVDFYIGMNGIYSIDLSTNKCNEEIDFGEFEIIDNYLIHYDDSADWDNNKHIVMRTIKIDKILRKNESILQKNNI